jgi:hypothetical protein
MGQVEANADQTSRLTPPQIVTAPGASRVEITLAHLRTSDMVGIKPSGWCSAADVVAVGRRYLSLLP